MGKAIDFQVAGKPSERYNESSASPQRANGVIRIEPIKWRWQKEDRKWGFDREYAEQRI
ncbi:hypothetical protein [Fusibacillus kribbianus]|uniref:Uncharacterized protein n=1 Tax=Fusibacillus kribbianus TaxID=3044208 RepID=A0AAP4BBR7_9FIRM|nr:hypothetical protein [Ruminococcus sp. YH-rum2234]MDI9243050.1 hypothetical protein [Ruminococcus sp. YH-rum2234]